MYTMEDWKRDGSLKLTKGQKVSREVVCQLIDCVPPAYYRLGLFQVGEAYDTDEQGKALFQTFKKEEDCWIYVGTCNIGETKHKDGYYELMY